MQKTLTVSQLILLVVAALFVIVRSGLLFIDEPLKAVVWHKLPDAGLLIGAGLLSLSIVVLALEKPRRYLRGGLLCLIGLCVALLPMSNRTLGLEYPASLSSSGEPLSIRVPMEGPAIVAWGGDSIEYNYHAEYSDQRWAYDLVKAPHSLGDNAKNEDFGCFGAVVVAPISGEIRTAVDGELDRKPDNQAQDIQNAFGNYIVLKPDGKDTRLIIAHLKNGSLKVERGDRVEEGEPIGECGNSGNTTEPHIHIHYIALHEFGGETVMTGLPLYFRDHSGPEMPVGGFIHKDGREIASGDIIEHVTTD